MSRSPIARTSGDGPSIVSVATQPARAAPGRASAARTAAGTSRRRVRRAWDMRLGTLRAGWDDDTGAGGQPAGPRLVRPPAGPRRWGQRCDLGPAGPDGRGLSG